MRPDLTHRLETILLVNSDPDLRHRLLPVLHRGGYEVAVAANRHEAGFSSTACQTGSFACIRMWPIMCATQTPACPIRRCSGTVSTAMSHNPSVSEAA